MGVFIEVINLRVDYVFSFEIYITMLELVLIKKKITCFQGHIRDHDQFWYLNYVYTQKLTNHLSLHENLLKKIQSKEDYTKSMIKIILYKTSKLYLLWKNST